MARTPGLIIPSAYPSRAALEADLKRRGREAGYTPFGEDDIKAILEKDDDSLAQSDDFLEDYLSHFGIKGMKWGQRKGDLPGVSRRVNKEASRDASEFARAKMFHGEGAGTRRKLIKATVDAKSKRDPSYKKAFDHHLDRQDMAKHATKARGERSRKDTKATIGKNARAVNRAINGPFAGPVAAAAVLGAYGAAKARGYDQAILKAGQRTVNRFRYGTPIDMGFLNKR